MQLRRTAGEGMASSGVAALSQTKRKTRRALKCSLWSFERHIRVSVERKARVSRESRLLFVTIGVAAVVLLGLARMRFPKPPVVDTATPPLEKLAARASYDALAADIERVRALVAPNLIVLRLGRPG